MEGVLLHLRMRWAAEGGKIIKYFLGLEKHKYISKQMIKLTSNNGEEIYDSQDIIYEVKTFFTKGYTLRDK